MSALHASVSRSLLRNRTPPAAQNIFLNLTSGRLRQFLNKRYGVRRLEMGEMCAGKFAQLIFSDGRAAAQNHECMWRLAPARMRQAHNRYFLHGRMTQQHALNFY